MKTKFTDLTVRSLAPGKYFDLTTPAFGIRVGKKRRTWIVMRGTDRQLISLGHYPSMTLQEARAEAKKLLATAQAPTGRVSFEEAYETFKKVHIALKKASTQRGYTHILETHYLPVLKNKRMTGINTHMLSAITDKLVDTPSELHHAQAVSRTFFRWAKRRQYITVNPLDGIQLAKPKRRKRILTDEELKKVWFASFQMAGDFPEIVRLLILMGQRRGETGALAKIYYSHNQQTVTLPGELTKNNLVHTFPVGPMASAIMHKKVQENGDGPLLFPARGPVLEGDRPFSGWSKCKKALDKITNIAPWTLHDLRRTFRSGLGRLGVRPDIAERLVNHVSSRTEMEETYDLYTYLPEMRDAMERWEAFVQSVCIDAPASLAA
ncbi:tyrosine-type recombinase/integrase [Bradyrhizobium cytisi]|uniref:tyrosine-type recombinase/integrase n=1 Tax=Bradyrhizobium cytisi TaxID=515489 RepID=UPI0016530EEB|nr:integrase arm-type DNA-binding domain-containing protein [Bradyrhizobium cytisi]